MTFYKLYKKLYPNQNIIVITSYKGDIDVEYRGAAKDMVIDASYYKAKIKRVMADSDGEIWIELK